MSTLLSNESATLTQTVASWFGVEPVTLSIQKGSSVVPSLSVNLKSPESTAVLDFAGNSDECPPKSKFSPVAPEVSPIKSFTW
jgi:hypothetical protein